MKNTSMKLLPVDFSGRLGRLTDPLLDSVEIIAGEDSEIALTTIAFLSGNNNPLRLNTLGLQTCMLALYGAGAAVKLTRQDLRELSTEIRSFMELYKLPEMQSNPNGQILRFVFNQAMQRAAKEAIPSGSRGDASIVLKRIQLDNSAANDNDDELRFLRTIAFTMLNPDPMRVNAASLAVAMLAIWASGARVKLSASQYYDLKIAAKTMSCSPVKSGYLTRQRIRQAKLVLKKAECRARLEGLSREPEPIRTEYLENRA